ncbi:MAG: hypothetical protein H0Z37_07790 [Firmicutes bacterium]|nr:hypothetical protein [Bacillota bacterium]
MRWLGTLAAVLTLAAVVANSVWFMRRGLGFGGFLSLAWPAALAALGIVAGALALGFASVRLMLRKESSRSNSGSQPGADPQDEGPEGDG